ncbi:MAG: acyltransferase family protein [Lachnospiraceae bacterium]|nr:acyltransferase family protein [Lachnospiraceae bacterium]
MTQTLHKQEEQYNLTFCILSALTIIMVVAGHCGYHILTVGELFPYYSFHVPLFMFISGYFYKDSEEEHPLNYIKKKLRRLIVPYLIWNLVYGLIAWAMRAAGFAMGEGISFRTLFIEPFLHGYQFIYNYAAWFVPVLFVVEMMNLLARIILRSVIRGVWRLCGKMSGRNVEESELSKEKEENIIEWVMLTGSLLVGVMVVWLAIGGHVWGNYKAPGKILLLFPCFQMGQFYLKKLEKHDTLGNVPYFAVLIGIQVILNVFFNGLAFSAVWCTGFANGPVIPYITIMSGIAFWLRVAKIITPAVGESRAVQFEMVYLAAGVIVPLGIQAGLDRVKSRIAFAIRR